MTTRNVKLRWATAMIAVWGLANLPSLFSYEAFRGPSEVLYLDKNKAFNGYTLLSSGYLIDMEGHLIHKWPGLGQLLDNGHVLGRTGQEEWDWDGNVVWKYEEKRGNYHPHHDAKRIYNPKLKAETTIIIMNKDLTHEQVIEAGADPTWKDRYDGAQMDAIVEIDHTGKVIWEWWFFDHLVQDKFSDKKNYVTNGKSIRDYPGKLDINWGKVIGRDWLHCNAIDFNQELDQVAVSSVHGEFYVIDHGATFIPNDPEASIKAASGVKGDFQYRWGDPTKYAQGEKPFIERDWLRISTGTREMGANHDIQWIKPGCPGAGNFLIFNNNDQVYQSSQQSEIIEINPRLNRDKKDTGAYVNPPEAGWYKTTPEFRTSHQYPRKRSNQIEWTFSPKGTSGFFSNHGSGTERLPNGNTLICTQADGHVFEVTKEGEVVWEYIIPVTNQGIKKEINVEDFDKHGSFRARRFGPNHPAFAERNLTPQGKLTELPKNGK